MTTLKIENTEKPQMKDGTATEPTYGERIRALVATLDPNDPAGYAKTMHDVIDVATAAIGDTQTLGGEFAPAGRVSMEFGVALELLKAGARVAREGWNGKGMWLVMIRPGNAMHRSSGGTFDMQPCIGMKTADNKMQPGWLPSQADMLADDWCVVWD